MNAVAESIDQRLHSLPASQAREFERLLRQLLEQFNSTQNLPVSRQSAGKYSLPSRDLKVRPGLDVTRLAHFDEDDLHSIPS